MRLLLLLQAGLAMTSQEVKTDDKQVQFVGYDCHRAQTTRMRQPNLCTPSTTLPLSPTVVHFDLYQLQTSRPLTGHGCEVKLTELHGRCSMFSHWEWVKAPTFNHPLPLPPYSCTHLWQSRSYSHNDMNFPLQEGLNQFSYVSAGAFTALAGGELSCVGEAVHYEGQLLEKALILVHADVTIYPVTLLKSFSSGAATVTSPLSVKGVGIGAKDVQSGHLTLPDKTIVLDKETSVCPLIPLRKQVVLTQLFQPSQPVEHLRMTPLFQHSPTIHRSHTPLNITNIVWTTPGLSLMTRNPKRLPSACGPRLYYKTSHPNIIVATTNSSSPNVNYTNQEPFLPNPAYSLSEKLELQLLQLSSKINNLHDVSVQMECQTQSFLGAISSLRPNMTDGFTDHRLKVIPLGESLLIASCPRRTYFARARDSAEVTNVTTNCTAELLVRDEDGNQRFLSPVERYARMTPTFTVCPSRSPSEHTAYPIFLSSNTGSYYYRDGEGVLLQFNSTTLLSPYDRQLATDTTVFFQSPTDPFMTASQLSILEHIDPILMSAVRGHVKYTVSQGVSYDGLSGNRGQTVLPSHTSWEYFFYQNVTSLVGGTLSSTAIYAIKLMGTLGGAIYFSTLLFAAARLYFCKSTSCGKARLSPEMALLVSEEVQRLLYERRGALMDFRPADTTL